MRVEWKLLRGLSGDDRARVLQMARRRRYDSGAVIFHEGEVGTALHFLESGLVAVRVTTPDGDSATLTIVEPGEFFGEMALLRRSSTRTATAVALDDVATLSLDREPFHRVCDEHPTVERLMVGVLAARVDRLSRHLMESLYLDVNTRIRRRLVELCRIFGSTDAATVVVRLTQEDLAGLAGTTRPTVNTLLRQLQRDGIVALSRSRIEILDVAALVDGTG